MSGQAQAGAHVSLKDFSVFLCRLDTATRAASCAGRPKRQLGSP